MGKNETINLEKLSNHLRGLNLVLTSSQLGSITANKNGAVHVDSRKVSVGDVYIAYKGMTSDGHKFLAEIIQKQPGLLIVEDESQLPKTDIPWIKVSSGREAWAYAYALLYDNPQDEMTFLGVTGTNGKSSTVWLSKELLASLGVPCLALGTLGAYLGEQFIPTNHTTPDPPFLFAILDRARKSGVKICVMEVSSQAIIHKRVGPIKYDACAFTSFSRDHLDVHQTMEEYLKAKLLLFTACSRPNSRHVFSDKLTFKNLPRPSGDNWIYGQNAKIKAKSLRSSFLKFEISKRNLEGISFILSNDQNSEVREGYIPMLADFALENFCAALLICEKAVGKEIGPDAWTSFAPVPGRLEAVFADHKGDHPFVCVDYAHTPDAIETALQMIAKLAKGKVWIVFGCGGDRDSGKRPMMAQAAEKFADQLIITSDNPRTEDPIKIIEQTVAGLSNRQKLFAIEADRRKAINLAIRSAKPEDAILVAGKGHEDYMVIGKERVHFDDRIEVRNALNLI